MIPLVFIATVFLFSQKTFAAPDSQIPPLSLGELTEQLHLNNPQLKQAQQNYFAEKAAIPQATALNNPQLGIIESPIPPNSLLIDQAAGLSYTLTQSFSFPGKKHLAGRIAEAQADIAQTVVDALSLQLIAQLKNDFYQLLVLQEQSEINQENIQRLEQIKQIAKVKYANSAAAYVDFLNAQVSKSSAENDQFALQRQIDTARQTLNTLVGRDSLTPLTVKGELPDTKLPQKSLAELETLALVNNPQIKSSSLQIRSSSKGLTLAKMSYVPDFQFILTNASDTSPWGYGELGNNYGVEFDLVLPTWFLSKERSQVSQAKANLLASQANDQSIRQQTRLSVDTIYNTLAQAVHQSDFIKTRQLEEARTAFRLGITSYASGNASLSDILTAQTNLRNTELQLLESRYTATQAFNNLVAAVGRDLE
ncbi:MAG: TolC family protein [Endomicrobiales bacterium]